MKKSIDGLTRDGRKLTREVMTTVTNSISLTFLCGISRRREQMAAVQEARDVLMGSNGNLMEIADTLSGLREKYRCIGCVGYCLVKPEQSSEVAPITMEGLKNDKDKRVSKTTQFESLQGNGR